jgi:ubiquinone/menaquinone biosynthesis C-methylase UbiE
MEKHDRVCPLEKAGSLESRFRKLLHNPGRMLKNHVREGMTVLDFGCGPGFFAIAMAKMVGASGKVVAADLQQGMLDKLAEKIRGTPLEKRIRLHRTKESEIGVRGKFDLILAFYIMHELPGKEKALGEMMSLLKHGGKLFMAEPNFKVSKQAFEETVRKAEKAGFKLAERPGIRLSRAAVFRK